MRFHLPPLFRRGLLRAGVVLTMTAAPLVFSGCLLVPSEVNDIHRDINQIKLEISRLQTTQNEEFRKIEFSLAQIDTAARTQQEISHSSTEDLQQQLSRIREDLARAAQGAAGLRQGPSAAEEKGLILSAQEEYAQGNYDAAISLYSKFLQDHPDSTQAPEVVFNIGRCHYEKEDFEKARQAFALIATQYPASSIIAESLYSKGLCLYHLSHYAAAQATFLNLQTAYPDFMPERVNEILKKISLETKS